MDLGKIYEGWSKSLGLKEVSEENRQLSLQRLKVCIECKHAKEMWLKKIIDGFLKRDKATSGIGCELCGCPVNEKSLVIDEQCPIGKW